MVEATPKISKQKLLVIAKTKNAAQAQCTEFAKLGFKAKATHIGATKVTSRFQAACVIVEEGDDYDLFADTLIRFQTVPIVAFVGAVEVAAEFKDAKIFATGETAAAGDFMKTRISEVQADINKVFEQFDEDKSGFIDRGELKMVADSLGVSLDASQVSSMIADIDLNGDGKISPDEFQLWWLSGRNGTTGNMSQLLASKLGGVKTLENMSSAFSALAAQAQKGVFKHNTHSINVKFNGDAAEEATTGMSVSANVRAMGNTKDAVHALKARILGSEKLPEDGNAYIYFSFNIKIKEGITDAANLFGSVTKALNGEAQIGMDLSGKLQKFDVQFNDGRLFIRGVTKGRNPRKLGPLMPFLQLANAFKDQTADQSVSSTITTGFNLAEMFAEDAEPIPNYIMKGMSEKLEVNMWDQFHKTILEMVKSGENAVNPKMLGMMLPLMIAKVTGSFAVDVSPTDVEEVMGLPQAAMAAMNVHALLTSMSPWGTIDDQELIDMSKDEDEDFDSCAIWDGFNVEGQTPVDMVNALTKRMAAIFEVLNTTGIYGFKTEEGQALVKGCGNTMIWKALHAISMAIDDQIEGEIGFEAQCNEEGQDMATHAHKQFSINGAGIGELVKAAMIFKASQDL